MGGSAKAAVTAATILRWIARVMLIFWAAFWLFFNIVSLFYWLGEQGPQGTVGHLVMALVIIVLLFAAWFLELLGGILLIAFSLLTFYQWGWHRPVVALTLCLPPLVMGVLFILCWSRSRRRAGASAEAGNG